MKKYIDLWEYAGAILEQVGTAALVTTAAEGKVNTMTIGWGTLGVEWGKPLFTVFVRQSRYTKELLDKNGEFTINVPLKGTDRKQALGFCGSKSGRDVDKFKELDLHLEEADVISVPGIKEFPITLECRVVYKQDQDLSVLEEDKCRRYYASGTANDGDYHTAYYGEVLSAYIIED
jgi:flavin reductase (DIM6/NTAB) family NADH-FMN oxidoreductase RutF